MLGRRVPQPDVVAAVVGGERDIAMSAVVGHGQRSIEADAGDGPGVTVADRFAAAGGEAAIVAAGGDDVTDVDVFAAGDRCRRFRVEVTGVEAGRLDGAVDGVDVVVGGRHQRRRASVVVVGDPGVGHPGEVLVQGAGDDPAVRLVGSRTHVGRRIARAVTRPPPMDAGSGAAARAGRLGHCGTARRGGRPGRRLAAVGDRRSMPAATRSPAPRRRHGGGREWRASRPHRRSPWRRA